MHFGETSALKQNERKHTPMKPYYSIEELAHFLGEANVVIASKLACSGATLTADGKRTDLPQWKSIGPGKDQFGNIRSALSEVCSVPHHSHVFVQSNDLPSNWKDRVANCENIREKHQTPSAQAGSSFPTATTPTEANHEKNLAVLFDLVTVAALEKTFPADGQWKNWAERASRSGLKDAAKEGRGKFNPYKAAVWFLSQGIVGWDLARCHRALVNNLPARSLDDKHLLTGD